MPVGDSTIYPSSPVVRVLAAAFAVIVLLIFVCQNKNYFLTVDNDYSVVVSNVRDMANLGLLATYEDLGIHPGSLRIDDNLVDPISTPSNSKSYNMLITCHGGKDMPRLNNVWMYRYDLEASHQHPWTFQGFALDPKQVEELEIQNLRGMKLVHEKLYIASAHSSTSKILVTDRCDSTMRHVDIFTKNGLDHPYDITYFRGKLYFSNQNANNIVYFSADSDTNDTKVHKFSNIQDPRGLSVDRRGRLWAASTKRGVFVFNITTGDVLTRLDVRHPVGLALDFHTNMMYVGSVKDNCVYQIDAETFSIVRILRTEEPYKLKHPAGIIVFNDTVFAVGQKSGNLYGWDTRDGAFKGATLTNFPKNPEQISIFFC